jgi:hypothetical protein
LDKQSDTIEDNLTGTCKECMVLRARTDITDAEGNRIGLDKDIYVHHILIVDQGEGKSMAMAPMVALNSNCTSPSGGSAGPMPGMGMMGMGGGPKAGAGAPAMGGHGHRKRQISSAKFSLFIAKGNEGDSTTYGAFNSTEVKSGYWIGKDDQLMSSAEVVNYKSVPQDVYLTIDMEYLSINGPRPSDYLDVAFGTLEVENCGKGIYLCTTLNE